MERKQQLTDFPIKVFVVREGKDGALYAFGSLAAAKDGLFDGAGADVAVYELREVKRVKT